MLTLKDVWKFQVIHKLSTISKNLDSLEFTKLSIYNASLFFGHNACQRK